MRSLAGSRPGSWLLARALPRLDDVVLSRTGGRHTAASLLAGVPVLQLTTTGRRSGLPRTVHLLGLRDGADVVVIASNFAQEGDPAWLANLRATPEATVHVEGEVRAVHAVEVVDEQERERLWRAALEHFPQWSSYERRAAHRRFAIVRLTAR